MSCLTLPAFPPLPSIVPLTIPLPTISPPAFDFSLDFCCKLGITVTLPNLPLGAVTVAVPGISAAIATINGYLKLLNAYVDALPLSCPLD